MRIATITSGPPDGKGGTDRHLSLLKDLLERDGNTVDCYHFEQLNPPRPWTFWDKVGFRVAGHGKVLAERVLRKSPAYDLIFVNSFLGAYLPSPGIPVINMFHSVEGPYAEATKKGMRYRDYLRQRIIGAYFENRSARKHHVVAISARIKRELKESYGVEATVVPYCYDENIFFPGDQLAARQRLKLPLDKRLVLFAGAWSYRKGVDIIAELVGKLPPDCLLVGAISTKESPVPIDPKIHILNAVPSQEMGWVYQACDMLAFPTRAEACPFVTKEAMACGLPLVTTTAGTGEDLKKDPVLGRWVVECPPAKGPFVDRVLEMLEFLKDPEQRVHLSQCFLNYAKSNWSKENFDTNWRNYLKQYQSRAATTGGNLSKRPNSLEATLDIYSLLRKVSDKLKHIADPDKHWLKRVAPYTMVSPMRLRNLKRVAQMIEANKIEGDVVECGTCRGGSAATLAMFMGKRRLWLYDSFEGLPDPSALDGDYAKDWKGKCLGNVPDTEAALKVAGLHPDFYTIKKGWFEDTLKEPHAQKVALLHCDADFYEPVKLVLETFYPLIPEGGIIVLDDFGSWEGCREAFYDFCQKFGEKPLLERVDRDQAWWVKGRTHNR
ncbi:MAG: TylF/MycF/NovP-related O-methyltransferase [Pirellulales bacterium]